MEGLSLAGNIQGAPTDALIKIFKSKSIPNVLKWVDDFVFFRIPLSPASQMSTEFQCSYDIMSIWSITDLLGIPWHPIEANGQDFNSTVMYLGFVWSLDDHSMSLPCKKHLKYLAKIAVFMSNTTGIVS